MNYNPLEILTLKDWHGFLGQYLKKLERDGMKPHPMPCLRCENSPLMTGWNCGGFTFKDTRYTAMSPLDEDDKCRVMLAVSDNFANFVRSEIRAHERTAKKKAEAAQMKLEV